ncbi:MAG: cytochrome b [Betaproteobacteria bacterium]
MLRRYGHMEDNRYTNTAIALHWLTALLIFCGFGLGLFMTGLELSPTKFRLYAWHKWIGITVFLLAALRVAWRAGHRPPPLPATMPPWQIRAAAVTHRAMYVLLVAIPLSGWIYSSATGISVVYLNLVPLPNLVAKNRDLAPALLLLHQTLNFTLAAMVVLHVAGALRHQFIDRDGLLGRMVPARR